MADIQADARNSGDGVRLVTWADASTADTIFYWKIPETMGAMANVQVVGTFGGATVTLAGSNDKTNWVTLKDLAGDDISLTASGMVDFTTAALFVKPVVSGGSGDDVTISLVVRG